VIQVTFTEKKQATAEHDFDVDRDQLDRLCAYLEERLPVPGKHAGIAECKPCRNRK